MNRIRWFTTAFVGETLVQHRYAVQHLRYRAEGFALAALRSGCMLPPGMATSFATEPWVGRALAFSDMHIRELYLLSNTLLLYG